MTFLLLCNKSALFQSSILDMDYNESVYCVSIYGVKIIQTALESLMLKTVAKVGKKFMLGRSEKSHIT